MNRNKLHLLAMTGLLMSGSQIMRYEKTPIKREPITPKGLKKFVIDGKDIYALNERNALRKANKNENRNTANN